MLPILLKLAVIGALLWLLFRSLGRLPLCLRRRLMWRVAQVQARAAAYLIAVVVAGYWLWPVVV